jgi:beta-N-acetylhexosaminidase
MMSKYIICFSVVILFGCGSSIEIIDRPINFSEKRVGLTKEYIKNHYEITPESLEIDPKIIVLHWTAINNFDSCYALFNREILNDSRPDLTSAGQVNVSIHFLVNRDGKIFQLMPDNIMARHCIGLNYNSIGIENVGGEDNVDNLTDEQIDSNIKIVRTLKKKYPAIEYLIGHHEYRLFENHRLWRETDINYRTVKYDPGSRFMNAVRIGTIDLNLKGAEDI